MNKHKGNDFVKSAEMVKWRITKLLAHLIDNQVVEPLSHVVMISDNDKVQYTVPTNYKPHPYKPQDSL